jgi:hypothetical protein
VKYLAAPPTTFRDAHTLLDVIMAVNMKIILLALLMVCFVDSLILKMRHHISEE